MKQQGDEPKLPYITVMKIFNREEIQPFFNSLHSCFKHFQNEESMIYFKYADYLSRMLIHWTRRLNYSLLRKRFIQNLTYPAMHMIEITSKYSIR